MLEKLIFCSLFTFAAWYTMQNEEIFDFIGNWFSDHLPPKLHNPIFECPMCMGPYYGSLFYWVVYHQSIKEWLVIFVTIIGFNYIVSRLFTKET